MIHRPGCKYFVLPELRLQNALTSASTTDINIEMKRAMEKVISYEQEVNHSQGWVYRAFCFFFVIIRSKLISIYL